MALYEKVIYDGIHKGNELDYCYKCNKPGSHIEMGKLKDKEVFKLHINGLEYCLCMEHFMHLLDNSNYVLIDKASLTDDDVITIPTKLAKEGTEEEVKQYIETAIKLKKEK